MAIDDQKDWAGCLVDEALEELDEFLRVHSPVHRHEPEVTAGADRRNEIHAEALAGRGHDGICSFGAQVVPAWESERTPASSEK